MNFRNYFILFIFTLVSCHEHKPVSNYTYYTADDISDEELDGYVSPQSDVDSETVTNTIESSGETKTYSYEPICLRNQPEEIVTRDGYKLSYNSNTKLANWVYWELTPSRFEGSVGRSNTFTPDYDIKSKQIAHNEDYSTPHYERGHMCPAADNKYSRKAMEDSFILSNICPQTPQLNGGDWRILEEKCRKWAKVYNKLYIVCGPIIQENYIYDTIGSNKVTVPTHYYKIVMRYDKFGNPHMIGFIYNNDNTIKSMRDYIVTVDKIEELTGIDFFPNLSDEGKIIESSIDIDSWTSI